MTWSGAFQKCIIFHFLEKFFCKHFYCITGFCDKKFNFCKFANFFADSKSRAQGFLMMYHLSYLDIKHEIQRGGQIAPSISWFSSTPAGIGLKGPLLIPIFRLVWLVHISRLQLFKRIVAHPYYWIGIVGSCFQPLEVKKKHFYSVLNRIFFLIVLKWTVSVISSEPSCKDGNDSQRCPKCVRSQ